MIAPFLMLFHFVHMFNKLQNMGLHKDKKYDDIEPDYYMALLDENDNTDTLEMQSLRD